MIIQYPKDVSAFINNHTKFEVNGVEWCYIPTWFRSLGDNLFEPHSFDKLPEEVTTFISSMRNINPNDSESGTN